MPALAKQIDDACQAASLQRLGIVLAVRLYCTYRGESKPPAIARQSQKLSLFTYTSGRRTAQHSSE